VFEIKWWSDQNAEQDRTFQKSKINCPVCSAVNALNADHEIAWSKSHHFTGVECFMCEFCWN